MRYWKIGCVRDTNAAADRDGFYHPSQRLMLNSKSQCPKARQGSLSCRKRMTLFRLFFCCVLAASLCLVASNGLAFVDGCFIPAGYTCYAFFVPTGVATPIGGVTFVDNNTLLIGGYAFPGNPVAANGIIQTVSVIRGAGGHITGIGAPLQFSTAPYVDDLALGPNGVVLFTGNGPDTLGQIKPGSASPDKTVPWLAPAPYDTVGGIALVPSGFPGAGHLKIVSYTTGAWFDATLVPDGSGTYDVNATTLKTILSTNDPWPLNGRGPEGMAYVKGTNPGFGGTDSVLVTNSITGVVAAYPLDSNGDPIVGSGWVFASQFVGRPRGGAIDPLTGDLLFTVSDLGLNNNLVFVISGFQVESPYDATVQQPINANGTSVFNSNRGVVPVKFTLSLDGSPTCQLPPAKIAVFRTSSGTPVSVNESDYLQPSDSGSNFRVDGCQYVYNLAANTLGPGSYTVQIVISGVSVGNAAFGLK
jgi:hypothetical protein